MSSARAQRRPASYEDLLKVPDNLVAEIFGGELYTSPRPRGPHSAASSALGALLVPPFWFGHGGPGGWWILDEPELHLGGDVAVPDLAGWRRQRMPKPPEGVEFSLAPDWVCEVLSPSTERTDRVLKLPVYARAGIPHLWLVNPIERILEVLLLEAGRWVVAATHGGNDLVRAAPFAEVEIDLLLLWGETRQGSS
jgi:Uma2 family endonuclease